MWPLLDNAPWFILTHYPEVNDSFSWLDGAGILMFVVGATVCVGGATFLSLWIADRLAPAAPVAGQEANRWFRPGLHKLAQGLIPSAGIGVFLGLSATTINLLKHEGVRAAWAAPVRFHAADAGGAVDLAPVRAPVEPASGRRVQEDRGMAGASRRAGAFLLVLGAVLRHLVKPAR